MCFDPDIPALGPSIDADPLLSPAIIMIHDHPGSRLWCTRYPFETRTRHAATPPIPRRKASSADGF
jgi:hypothetical protein